MCTWVRIRDFYKTVLGICDPQVLQIFEEYSRVETVPRGTRLVSMGEQMGELYFLVEGVLRGYVVEENGQDITDCFICQAGDPVIGCGGFCAPSDRLIQVLHSGAFPRSSPGSPALRRGRNRSVFRG